MDPFNESRTGHQGPDGTSRGEGTATPADSFLVPTFLRMLADPSIKTVMLCGCGGGFDFVHSLTLYPELRRLGKGVVIVSYFPADQPLQQHGSAGVRVRFTHDCRTSRSGNTGKLRDDLPYC